MAFYDGRILGTPTVSRRMANAQFGPIEIQEVTIDVDNSDGTLSGDLRGIPFTFDLYDTVTEVAVVQGTFVVSEFTRSRGRGQIVGINLDLSSLEAPVPTRVVDPVIFPLAVPEAQGKTLPWIWGNVTGLPLLNVCNDVLRDEFDYFCGIDTLAAIRALRRLDRDPDVNASFDIAYDELEPYPGMDGLLVNGSMEDWDSGPTSAPTGWTLTGAGAAIAKDITVGQFDEGNASASATRTGFNVSLTQDLMANFPSLPLSWWQGRTITFTARVRATVASIGNLRIQDSAGSTVTDGVDPNSPPHTGSGLFETLSVTRTLSLATTSAVILCRIEGSNGTVQFDDIRVYFRARSWSEVLRPDLYEGYTVIRFYLQQSTSSGAMYPIVADLNGLQPNRNLVRGARELLSNASSGLVQTVDAAACDQAEIDATFTYDDAVLLDGPQVYLNFHDPIENTELGEPPETVGSVTNVNGTARDRSGYERHAAAAISDPDAYTLTAPTPSTGTNDAYVDAGAGGGTAQASFRVPYDVRPGFESADAVVLEIWYYIDAAVVTGTYPICEKRIDSIAAVGGPNGPALWQDSSELVFGVRANGGANYDVRKALTAGVDTQRWIHVVGKATDGDLLLYMDGALVATSDYDDGATPGVLDVGAGDVWVMASAFAGFSAPRYRFSRFAMYSTALSAARIAAHHTAIALDIDPYIAYDSLILASTPTFYYKLAENAGELVMRDTVAAHSGVWVGPPLLGPGVDGPLPTERGYVLGSTGARFANDVAKYGVETGMTLNDAAATILGFYKPQYLRTKSGLVEKCIGTGAGAARGTQWSVCQQAAGIRLTLVHAAGTATVNIPLLAEDVGRYGLYGFSWSGGTISAYKNGALVATGTYTAPVASGVGDFLVGIQGTVAGVRTRPCQGDLGRWSYHPIRLTDQDPSYVWTAATWYNGGVTVDMALTEARPAQAWLRLLTILRGVRLGVSTTGAWVPTVDTVSDAPTVTLRDGPGDGTVPNLIDLRDRKRPALKNAIRDYVIKYRRDLLTGEYLCEERYPVSTQLDAHGNRIGVDWEEQLESLRTVPAAARTAQYLGKYAIADEQVTAVVEPVDGITLFEGIRVFVTDPSMGYSGDTLLIREARKGLEESEFILSEDPVSAFTYDPRAFPMSPGPEE